MSTASLFLTSTALAFSDSSGLPSRNPSARYFDWTRSRTVLVEDPQEQAFTILPGVAQSVFSGTRTTAIDATTSFAVAGNALGTAYRFSYVAGTAPAFKTDRALALAAQTVTLTANSDGTLSVSSTGIDLLATLQPNDLVLIPGTTTGDAAGPFSMANEGLWTVLIASGSAATLQRPYGSPASSGVSETVIVVSNGQVVGFANDGVQIGDVVEVSAGFVAPTLRTYIVSNVAPTWFEVVSTLAIPAQVAIPGFGGISFYTSSKKWVRIEADQEAVAQFNGDSSLANRLSPLVPGSDPGYLEKWGRTYALTLVNRSLFPMRARVWTAG